MPRAVLTTLQEPRGKQEESPLCSAEVYLAGSPSQGELQRVRGLHSLGPSGHVQTVMTPSSRQGCAHPSGDHRSLVVPLHFPPVPPSTDPSRSCARPDPDGCQSIASRPRLMSMPRSGFPDITTRKWSGSFLRASVSVKWVSGSWRSVPAGDHYDLLLLQLTFHGGFSGKSASSI